MKFNEVLEDMAAHVIEDADMAYQAQQRGHDFKPFTCERSVISDGGNTFRVKIEFEPNPMSALQLVVERN